ncbi:MAG: hypothetical protein DSY42_05690 [Aquifex sp.]|nr:MAG: hypothetical protein DSY42_05690 [Aquifex sp.]
MKLLKNFTIEEIEALEESLEEKKKEKVYVELPKIPKVSLRNYKALAREIREAITRSGISPDTWEDFLDYFNLKLKKKGKYAETTLDKAIETYLRKRLGWKITDVWREVIGAYKDIEGKYMLLPSDVLELLTVEEEIRSLSNLPDVEVVLIEKKKEEKGEKKKPRRGKSKLVPVPKRSSRKTKTKPIWERLKTLKVKGKEWEKFIKELKKKHKNLYIFYVKEGKKFKGVIIFYEKP